MRIHTYIYIYLCVCFIFILIVYWVMLPADPQSARSLRIEILWSVDTTRGNRSHQGMVLPEPQVPTRSPALPQGGDRQVG